MPSAKSAIKSKSRRKFLAATPKTVRHLNRALVVDFIRQQQPLSRAELARLTGIHRSNIANIVEELMHDGLLSEEPAKNFGRGRTPDLISFARSAARVVAISLRRAHTTVVLATLSGTIENSFKFETPATPEQFVEAVDEACRALLQTATLMEGKRAPIRQVVVSIPGIVTRINSEKLSIWTPGLPSYSNVDLAAILKRRLEIRVHVANNAGLAALSVIRDKSFGDLTGNFVLLAIGDAGIGSGIVMHRSLYTGFDAAFAGELGHMVVDPKGPACNCGRSGCWQCYVCDEATWRRFKPNTPFTPLVFEEFLAAVESGSAKARLALQKTAEYLSLGISNIAVMLNPERILLAGALTKVWPLLDKDLRSAFFLPHHHVLLQPVTTPLDALYLRGAVEEALSIVLSDAGHASRSAS